MKVSIIAAISADGYIARESDELANWTSKEDKQLFVSLTKEAGVMIMGATTFQTIGKALPGRKTIIYSNRAEKFSGIEGDIQVTNAAPDTLLRQLKDEGYDSVMICGGAQIYDLFLRAKLVTDLYITIEPILFGSGVPFSSNGTQYKLALKSTKQLNDNTILLHYKTLAT